MFSSFAEILKSENKFQRLRARNQVIPRGRQFDPREALKKVLTFSRFSKREKKTSRYAYRVCALRLQDVGTSENCGHKGKMIGQHSGVV